MLTHPASDNQPSQFLNFVDSGNQAQAGFTVENNKGTPGENQDMVLRDVEIL
jgi:hypothetical protein